MVSSTRAAPHNGLESNAARNARPAAGVSILHTVAVQPGQLGLKRLVEQLMTTQPQHHEQLHAPYPLHDLHLGH